jgi:hypothetical protein
MKVFLCGFALSALALLSSTSSQARANDAVLTDCYGPEVVISPEAPAEATTAAGGIRGSFGGGRPSYSGGFRSSSSSSYRSFSPSPSRGFTFRSSSPTSTYSSRPAAAPRSYSYNAPKATIAAPVSRSTTKRTVINNHYHGESGHSGGGGLSMMDYVMLHSLANHNNGPTYVNAQPNVVTAVPTSAGAPTMVVDNGNYDAPAVIYQEESHFWRNVILFIVVILVVAAIVAAGIHYSDLDAATDED